MKINIDPVISSRIRVAWAKLSPEQRAELMPAIAGAHQQAMSVSRDRKMLAEKAAPHHLMLVQSVLSNDADNVVNSLEAGIVIDVDGDGVIWGTGKYEQLDPGWLEAFAVFLESIFTGKHKFITNPVEDDMPDTMSIGLAGDWGTGDWRVGANPAPSTKVGKQMASLNLDLTIHLGDVYYAGTIDQELHDLTNIWPSGPVPSLALNSNHEMYSGAKPYFDAIVAKPFGGQNGCSYFALENKNWVIVGLDSTYYSRELGLYMDGSIGAASGPQTAFLKAQALKGKKIIVLTHHNGLAEDGMSLTNLWSEVMSAFPNGAGPTLWYWGHAHAGVAYKPFGPANVSSRCCGHGALPWGPAPSLASSKNVGWYENRLANDPDIPQRVFNGFAVLTLNGPNVQETFYDENGGVAWKSP